MKIAFTTICFFAFTVPQISQGGCDQTLSPGANVGAAVSSAVAGSTLCLRAGNYGQIDIVDANKVSDVILQSETGRDASAYVHISGTSNHIKVQNMTLSQSGDSHNEIAGGTNITFSNNTFTGQLVIYSGGNSKANILIDHNSFDGISVCSNCYEGRLEVQGGGVASGVTISNNHFGGGGESDGVQTGSSGVVIGPGNVFDGIVQANYSRHIDAIQGYGQDHTTILGNYFINNSDCLMFPDGGNTEIIMNNVFVGSGDYGLVQMGSIANGSFIHNTVSNGAVGFNKKAELPTASSNAIIRDNIWINGARIDLNNCTNCIKSFNLADASSVALCASSSNATGCGTFGDNFISGTPTFIGGASTIKLWAGWQLASTSLGYKNGSDGQDRGALYYGSGSLASIPVLLAPTNLRIN
ncbi:MAG: hypothetical protein ACXVB4_19230 [Pseudobdellovibrionaceae bacterium]